MSSFIFIIFCCCGWFYCMVYPPIRGDFLYWKYTLFWDRSRGWGAGSLEYLLLFFGSMLQLLLVSLFSPSSFLEAFLLSFWRVKSSFLFTVILPPSFFVGLGPVLFFIFFGIFCCGPFLNHPSYAFYDFISIIWVAEVCFLRVFKSTL